MVLGIENQNFQSTTSTDQYTEICNFLVIIFYNCASLTDRRILYNLKLKGRHGAKHIQKN